MPIKYELLIKLDILKETFFKNLDYCPYYLLLYNKSNKVASNYYVLSVIFLWANWSQLVGSHLRVSCICGAARVEVIWKFNWVGHWRFICMNGSWCWLVVQLGMSPGVLAHGLFMGLGLLITWVWVSKASI